MEWGEFYVDSGVQAIEFVDELRPGASSVTGLGGRQRSFY